MAPRRAALALAAFHVAAAAQGRYVPFSDLESLRPQRLHQFCEGESFASVEGHGNVRRCSHSVTEELEDGGRVELGWQMHADPDRILSLDTEAELGVQLLECAPSLLRLVVPDSHLHHVQEERLIVGSRFVHGCEHLGDRHLYHRIRNVVSHKQSGDHHHLSVATEELPSIAHAIPKWDLQFSWMPAEALDENPFPEMKTDYGLNRAHLAKKKEKEQPRRLFGLDSITNTLKSLASEEGVEKNTGGFQSAHGGSETFDTQNGLLNFMPKQLSNFGWNWDFFMNTTEEPDFYMDIPGAKGVLHVRKPYIKVHSGIYLNFSSHFGSLTQPPKVQWTFGLRGKGHVQGRALGSMNTTGDAGEDPIRAFKLDMFQEFETPKWFSKIDVVSGNMPVTMEPGFQMSATMYHQGTFHGAVGFGGRTQGQIHPSLTYDSDKGFESNFQGNLTNTSYWPPLWIIFTDHFEMGVILKPQILMKGDFAGMERATLALQGRPYMNISIVREGGNSAITPGGTVSVSTNKTLVAYPMRIMGLRSGDSGKKYKVKVVVNGQMAETSAQPRWGEVWFKDHVSNFELGSISSSQLLDPSTVVHVTVFEVDTGSAIPTTTTLGTGQTSCKSLESGVCVLSPADVVVLNAAGVTVASVQLALVWKDDAKSWFASQIKGLSLAFPQAIVRQEALMQAGETLTNEVRNVALHMVAAGRTTVIPLTGTLASGQTPMTGKTVLELSPTFVETWAPCSMNSDDCIPPRLELWANNEKVAVGSIPRASSVDSKSQAFLAADADEDVAMPVDVALHAIGSDDLTMALVTMKMKVLDTLSSSLFLAPSLSTGEVKWVITEVDPKHAYSFKLQAYTTAPLATAGASSLATYSQVNDELLIPVGAPESFNLVCTPLSSAGLASETPCVFAAGFSLEGLQIPAGGMATLELTWTDKEGVEHVMFSPPVQMSSTLLPRLLQEDSLEERHEERRLFSREAWNARIQQHSECKQRELKFNLGTGLKVRGRVEGLDMPDGFPKIGGSSSSQPGISTGFKTIFQEHPGEEAEDALGGGNGLLCQLGLCEGVLPGCSEGGTKAEHFPSLVFNVNRPMHFQETSRGSFEGMMKEALAYAFSALPEAVDLAIREVNTTKLTHKIHKSTTAAPNWWDTPATTREPSAWPSQPVAPAPAPTPQKSDVETTDAFKEWWSGAETRRLTTAKVYRPFSQVGDQDELPAELAENQIRLDFKKGVPFVIDRPLVEVLLKAGYFSSVEDVEDDLTKTHGPLQITGFYVDSGIDGQAIAKPTQSSEMLPMYRTLFSMLTVPLAAAVVATTLAAVYRLSGRYRAVPTEGDEDAPPRTGLE